MNLLKSKIYAMLISLLVTCGALNAQETQIAKAQDVQSWMERYEQSQDQEIRGHIYGATALNQLMAQPGVTQIKIYNALDDNGQRKLVFQGVGSDQGEVGLAFDISKACPPVCGGYITEPVESIGAPIDLSSAHMMVSNFSLAYPNAITSYTYDAATIHTIIKSNQASGLFLAYGIDAENRAQLILQGLSASGNLIDGPVGINAQVNYSHNLVTAE